MEAEDSDYKIGGIECCHPAKSRFLGIFYLRIAIVKPTKSKFQTKDWKKPICYPLAKRDPLLRRGFTSIETNPPWKVLSYRQ